MDGLIKEILREAGKIAMAFFGKDFRKRTKDENPHSVVTEADMECERYILKRLEDAYPGYGYVTEESGTNNGGAEFVWYIDPIDGTRNFETRVPLFGISVALANKGEVTHGGIYLPATDELTYAERGGGAWLNDRIMHCSEREELYGSIGIGMVSAKQHNIAFLQILAREAKNTAWVNSMGCVAQAAVWTADGRRDYYLTPNPNAWDLAAASLILSEAGCTVTDLKGEDWQTGKCGLIAANSRLQPRLVEIARSIFA